MALPASVLLHCVFLLLLLQLGPVSGRRSPASLATSAGEAETAVTLIAPGAMWGERPVPARSDLRLRGARRTSPALPSSSRRGQGASAPSPGLPGDASAAEPRAAGTAAERLRVRSWDWRLWPPDEVSSAPPSPRRAIEGRLHTGIRDIMDSATTARRGLLYGPNRGCGSAGEACGIGAPGAGVPSALGSGAPLMPLEVSRARADATPLRRDPQTRASATWLLIHDAAFQAELRRVIGERVQAMRARADGVRRKS